ncbi:hypothetical protein AB0B27_21400 [Micromonospora rifamycinica]|uniref:hypothetical protein n=1 Tax=Micromonospora rifamycinica TaxID=291594 RepID=UPI0033DDFD83
MSPVVPTSPLWWVARGMSRLLTSLAVALAFAAAGPGLPGPALFEPAATALTLDLSPSFSAATAQAAPVGRPDRIRAGDPQVERATAVRADRADGVALAVPADAVAHTVPADAGQSLPAATLATPTGRVPAAAAGPRAPPAG